MRYFVCFCYEEEGKTGFGNTTIEMDDVVTGYRDIIEMERRLEAKIKIVHPILLDYKLLGSPAFEYARCGDTETLRVTGNSMTLTPDIKVSIGSDGGAGIGGIVRGIAETIDKMLISKGQE